MKNLDRIERYINHQMTETELWEFRNDLDNNPQLAEEYAMAKALHISLKSQSSLKLMQTMEQIKNEQLAKQKAKILNVSRKTLTYAAGLLLLIAAGLGYWHLAFNVNIKDSARLFEAYYQPEPVSFAVRSATLGSDQPVMFGLDAYKNKEYEKAISYFSQSPENPMGQLYSGLSNIELGQYKQAIVNFKNILKLPDNLFSDQAAWYLALCYLKTNQQKELQTALYYIASGRSIYKTKAHKLLNELGLKSPK